MPVKNLEFWVKRAGGFVLFGSIFMPPARVSPCLSRLLEAVAKSIRHSVAMITILATEVFQARRDAAIATSKLLLDNSG